MTLQEAWHEGYEELDTAWTRGYVSRNAKVATLPVCKAGGERKGLLYVVLPSNFGSSTYTKRLYLGKKNA
jgi:hypothetical protein